MCFRHKTLSQASNSCAWFQIKRRRLNKEMPLKLHTLCDGNSRVTMEFHLQRESNEGFWCFFLVSLGNLWIDNLLVGDLWHHVAQWYHFNSKALWRDTSNWKKIRYRAAHPWERDLGALRSFEFNLDSVVSPIPLLCGLKYREKLHDYASPMYTTEAKMSHESHGVSNQICSGYQRRKQQRTMTQWFLRTNGQ